jgi:hypothetical protein
MRSLIMPAWLLSAGMLAACESPSAEIRRSITSVAVLGGGFEGGPLVVTWSTLESDTLPVQARRAWVTDNGLEIAWVGGDGAGGYEDEGEALHLSPADAPGEDRLVLRETFMIEDVHEMTWGGDDRLLLVRMRDGGAGNPHIVVVHPLRGPLYRAVNAVVAQEGDNLLVARRRGEGPRAVVMATDTLHLPTLRDAAILPPAGTQP